LQNIFGTHAATWRKKQAADFPSKVAIIVGDLAHCCQFLKCAVPLQNLFTAAETIKSFFMKPFDHS
jgi:hypothetical protein